MMIYTIQYERQEKPPMVTVNKFTRLLRGAYYKVCNFFFFSLLYHMSSNIISDKAKNIFHQFFYTQSYNKKRAL